MVLATIAYGGLVGMLVGMTGIGGGALMMPFLLLVLRLPPLRAVGTDLVYSALTKSVGSVAHARAGHVRWREVGWLAVGSVPATALALWQLASLTHAGESGAARAAAIVRPMTGAALVLVAVVMTIRALRPPSDATEPPDNDSDDHLDVTAGADALGTAAQPQRRWLEGAPVLIAVGAAVGALVALTSVGGGSLLFVVLSLGTSLGLRQVIGTELAHAALISSIDAVAHLGLGNVDFMVTSALLFGALPGVWLGSRVTVKLPERLLRGGIAALLLAAGARLLAYL